MFRAVLLLVVACTTGSGSPPAVDAPPGSPMCTMAVYDQCTSNTQCTSGNCHLFEQSGFQVCTQACSTTAPCPNDSAGHAGTCNNMGICKPTVANACTP